MTTPRIGTKAAGRYLPGASVAVRCRFDGSWVDGFEIVEEDTRQGVYRVRRRSDRVQLPADFTVADLRADDVVEGEDPLGAWVPQRPGR